MVLIIPKEIHRRLRKRFSCKLCDVPLTDENKVLNGKYIHSYCKPCTAALSRARLTKYNREAHARHYRKSKYGLSVEDYAMLCETYPVCGVCSSPDNLVIDHCHISGQVRGRLCSKCNIGLGQFQDNKELLLKGAEYLENNYSKY